MYIIMLSYWCDVVESGEKSPKFPIIWLNMVQAGFNVFR